MNRDPSSVLITRLGERLREARLNARLTVREAAAAVGLRAHGTLVRYENGNVIPHLDRLAVLARIYDVSLAGLLVADDAQIPIVTMLEHATAAQIGAFGQLLQHAVDSIEEASSHIENQRLTAMDEHTPALMNRARAGKRDFDGRMLAIRQARVWHEPQVERLAEILDLLSNSDGSDSALLSGLDRLGYRMNATQLLLDLSALRQLGFAVTGGASRRVLDGWHGRVWWRDHPDAATS